jgi:hypothetical protein
MATPKITPAEYQQALFTVATAGRLIVEADVPELLRKIEHCEAFGGFVDPTLYRDKIKDVQHDKDMLEAALPLWRWARKVQASAQAAQAQARGAGPCTCGGTFERHGVSSGTCGTVWGPLTCSKCGAILAEDPA